MKKHNDYCMMYSMYLSKIHFIEVNITFIMIVFLKNAL